MIPYALTPIEYGQALEVLLMAARAEKFEDLVPGNLYFYRAEGGGYLSRVQRQVIRVGRMTPTKRKATVGIGPEYMAAEALAKSLPGDFYLISEELAARVWLTHRQIVEDALKAGRDIPQKVRRYHPDLFVTIPEGITAEALSTLLTGWKAFTSISDVEGCIASTHESLAAHDRDSAMLVVRGGSTQAEMDKARQSLLGRLALYTWLMPLVVPGGTFAVEPTAVAA